MRFGLSGDKSGLNSEPHLSGIKPLEAAAKSGLNRSMLDQGLGQLRTMLEEKAKERGRVVIPVDPKNTSRRCSVCGHTDPDNRQSQELFRCVQCGHSENADVNAAKNILLSATS